MILVPFSFDTSVVISLIEEAFFLVLAPPLSRRRLLRSVPTNCQLWISSSFHHFWTPFRLRQEDIMQQSAPCFHCATVTIVGLIRATVRPWLLRRRMLLLHSHTSG